MRSKRRLRRATFARGVRQDKDRVVCERASERRVWQQPRAFLVWASITTQKGKAMPLCVSPASRPNSFKLFNLGSFVYTRSTLQISSTELKDARSITIYKLAGNGPLFRWFSGKHWVHKLQSWPVSQRPSRSIQTSVPARLPSRTCFITDTEFLGSRLPIVSRSRPGILAPFTLH